MNIPLRENGIVLTILALAALGGLLVAELLTASIAEEPVTITITAVADEVADTPVDMHDATDETEALDLVRSEAHQQLMSNPEYAEAPELLLEELTRLAETEPDSPALFNDMGVVALRAGKPEVAVGFLRSSTALRDDYARAWYNLGIALGRDGHHEESIAAYRAALDRNPGYQEAALNLGARLRGRERYQEAAEAFALAAEISSGDTRARALFLEGEMHDRMGNHEAAARVLRRSTEYNPRKAETWFELGRALIRINGEEDTALAAFDNAAAIARRHSSMRLAIADELEDLGRDVDAIRYLQAAVQEYPTDAAARDRLAAMFIDMGDLAAARTQYQWLAENPDTAADAARYRAELSLLEDNPVEAARQLRNAVRQSAYTDVDSWMRMADLLRRFDNSAGALNEYKALLERYPGHEDALMEAAETAMEIRRLDEAEGYIRNAIELDPKDPDAWFMLARLNEARGDSDSAVDAYQHGLSLNPDDRGAQLAFAILLRRMGDSKRAIELYEAILDEYPRYTLARYNLAVVLAAEGREEEAADHYVQVLEQDPENEKARLNLAVIRRAQGNLEEAEFLLRDGLAQDPSNVSARFNLALLLGAMDRNTEKETELQRILRLDPEFAKAWRSLGRLLEARNDIEAAADAYLNALPLEPEETSALVMELANKAVAADNTALADRLLNRLLVIAPDHAAALALREKMAATSGN